MGGLCLSACLSACLSVYLPVCLSACLHVYLPACLSACLSICLSICLSVCLCVCLHVLSCPVQPGLTLSIARYTNYESGTRIPLIIHRAGQTEGLSTAALVEANDILPTTAAVAGLAAPPICSLSSQAKNCTEGVSALPLWEQPAQPWKRAAFSQFAR